MNNNIQESYCSIEVSKLLTDKGCTLRLIPSGEDGKYCYVSCPTHALAIEWIRVNFKIICGHTNPVRSGDILLYGGDIWLEDFEKDSIVIGAHDSPQEATEAALLYTLKNLI